MVLQALPKSVNRAPSSRSPAEQVSSAASVSSLLEGLVSVQPHALDRHVPALCGPLQVRHYLAGRKPYTTFCNVSQTFVFDIKSSTRCTSAAAHLASQPAGSTTTLHGKDVSRGHILVPRVCDTQHY